MKPQKSAAFKRRVQLSFDAATPTATFRDPLTEKKELKYLEVETARIFTERRYIVEYSVHHDGYLAIVYTFEYKPESRELQITSVVSFSNLNHKLVFVPLLGRNLRVSHLHPSAFNSRFLDKSIVFKRSFTLASAANDRNKRNTQNWFVTLDEICVEPNRSIVESITSRSVSVLSYLEKTLDLKVVRHA